MSRLLLILAIVAAMLALSPDADAEVSAGCYAHLAALPADQKTTAAGDRRYHLSKGEESPCTEFEANEYDQANSSSDDSGRDKKSRYCRKRWFC